MTTKQQRDAVAAIQAWCKKQKIELLTKPRHVHPRAYVVGYAAPSCLIVAECWADSEPQLRKFNRENPLRSVRCFDGKLRPGDWCVTAYVNRPGCGETIAVQISEAA